jgi:hypothetical protein
MSRRFNIQQLPTGSYQISGSFSGSFAGDGSALSNITASLAPNYTLTSSFNAFTSSYVQDSSSFDTRILNNSGSIDILSGSFETFSGSYIQDSSSFDTRILANSSSIDILSGSFETFTQTYNTGSFTGSFTGDGSGLTGVSDTNFANTDLTFTGNRSHDTNGNSLILRSSVAGANNFSLLGSGNGSTSRTYFEMGQQKNGGFSTSVFLSSFSPDYNNSLWGSFFAGSSMISTYHETPATTQGTGNLYFDLSHFTGTLTNKYFAWHAAPILTARGLNTEMMRLHVLSDGNGYLGIGTQGVPQERLHVNGNAVVTGSLNVTGGITGSYTGSFVGDGSQLTGIVSSSYALTASYAEVAGAGAGFPFSGSAVITGSLLISSSTNQQLTLIGSGSDQPIFTVQGSSGELFSITDNLSGSLFSVNDISGLPILEVFSDNTVLIGDYQAPALYTTKRVTSVAGNNVIYSLTTSSYDGAFFDYVAKSGSNARAGNIMALWSGTSVNFTETTTTDFGSTSGLAFTVFISGSNLVLSGSTSTANWNIKTIIRSI